MSQDLLGLYYPEITRDPLKKTNYLQATLKILSRPVHPSLGCLSVPSRPSVDTVSGPAHENTVDFWKICGMLLEGLGGYLGLFW